jgi:hypothetical protein
MAVRKPTTRKRRAPAKSRAQFNLNDGNWHLDKRVNLPLILSFVGALIVNGFIFTVAFRDLQLGVERAEGQIAQLAADSRARDEKLIELVAIQRDVAHMNSNIISLRTQVEKLVEAQIQISQRRIK